MRRLLGAAAAEASYETPSLPVAYAVFNATSGAVLNGNLMNVTSVTNNANGDNTVTIQQPMLNDHLYAIGACNGTTVGVAAYRDGSTSSDITSSSVRCVATGGGVVDPQTTSTYYSLIVFAENS